MARTRWIDCTGIDNIRDLGGLPVQGGRVTRRGVLYRASTLQDASPADADLLVGYLGIRTLIDLRRPGEARREGLGHVASTAVTYVNLPVGDPHHSVSELVPDGRRVDLASIYSQFLAESADSLVAAVRIAAVSRRRPTLFHCAAGKDRTGVLASLILDAVGVPMDAIADDYALTSSRMERIRARLAGLESYQHIPAVDPDFFRADAVTMETFLHALHEEHGGAAAWLRSQGLSTEELARLRHVLVATA
ncbi:tyrosine-protein phosphatase [Streptomyces sp. NPDC001984]|uniref:tyrosine-protein phosphatase n=1 Tax=Streptomyces sp. NPDC002619 TaxID=3364655 RepID=UPI0036C3D76B